MNLRIALEYGEDLARRVIYNQKIIEYLLSSIKYMCFLSVIVLAIWYIRTVVSLILTIYFLVCLDLLWRFFLFFSPNLILTAS